MGLDCIRYADANRIPIYGLFLHGANAKIDVSKETHHYKSDIVISGLHCNKKNSARQGATLSYDL